MLTFDKGNKMGISVYFYYKYSLTTVFLIIWIFNDVQQLPPLNIENDLLKRNTPYFLQPFVLIIVPGKIFHPRC